MRKKSKFLIISVLVFIALIVGIFYGKSLINLSGGTIHKVVLTEDGFRPEIITIKKGDTVEFSSNLGNPYWPASNIHPTHGMYPEFDPMDAVMPEETWSFRFDKGGEWMYHDHLAPYFTGSIMVE